MGISRGFWTAALRPRGAVRHVLFFSDTASLRAPFSLVLKMDFMCSILLQIFLRLNTESRDCPAIPKNAYKGSWRAGG